MAMALGLAKAKERATEKYWVTAMVLVSELGWQQLTLKGRIARLARKRRPEQFRFRGLLRVHSCRW
jgi:hypothetical protein